MPKAKRFVEIQKSATVWRGNVAHSFETSQLSTLLNFYFNAINYEIISHMDEKLLKADIYNIMLDLKMFESENL